MNILDLPTDIIRLLLSYCDDITHTILYYTYSSIRQYINKILSKLVMYERVMLRYQSLLPWVISMNCQWNQKSRLAATVDDTVEDCVYYLGSIEDEHVHLLRNYHQLRLSLSTDNHSPVIRLSYVWHSDESTKSKSLSILPLDDASELERMYLTEWQQEWTAVNGKDYEYHIASRMVEWNGRQYSMSGHDDNIKRTIILTDEDCNTNTVIREHISDVIRHNIFSSNLRARNKYEELAIELKKAREAEINESLRTHSRHLMSLFPMSTTEDAYNYITDYGMLPDKREVIIDIKLGEIVDPEVGC